MTKLLAALAPAARVIATILALAGLTVGAAALVAWLSTPALAQTHPVCADHAVVVESLRTMFGETVVAVAETSTGRLIEVFASDDGETWTLTITTPAGRACVGLIGKGWLNIPVPKAGQGA